MYNEAAAVTKSHDIPENLLNTSPCLLIFLTARISPSLSLLRNVRQALFLKFSCEAESPLFRTHASHSSC